MPSHSPTSSLLSYGLTHLRQWQSKTNEILVLALCLLIGILVGCANEQEVAVDASPEEVSNSEKQDQTEVLNASIRLASIEEIKLQISESGGKLTIVDFWSTSCVPCMKEFPELVEVAKDFQQEVQCISVNVDYIGLKNKPPANYQQKAVDFLTKVEANQIINLLATDADETVASTFGYAAIPNVMIFDSQGKLLQAFNDANSDSGVSYQQDIVPALKKYIVSAGEAS